MTDLNPAHWVALTLGVSCALLAVFLNLRRR